MDDHLTIEPSMPRELEGHGRQNNASLYPGQFTFDGDYRLEEKIGHGSFGEVWKARYMRGGFNEVRALKFPRGETLGHYLFREHDVLEKVLTSLGNAIPGMVRYHGMGRSQHQPYLVFEHCALGDLHRAIHRQHCSSPEGWVMLLRGALETVALAHEAGIAHRDLKPSNILLRGVAETCVADFGLSRFTHPTVAGDASDVEGIKSRPVSTGIGNGPVGTQCYMAPEMKDGRLDTNSHEALCRVDVYALGVVLAHCFAGNTAIEGGRLPRHVRALLPRHLVEAVERATEPVPGDRFAAARGLLKALDAPRVTQASPPPPPPPPPPKQTPPHSALWSQLQAEPKTAKTQPAYVEKWQERERIAIRTGRNASERRLLEAIAAGESIEIIYQHGDQQPERRRIRPRQLFRVAGSNHVYCDAWCEARKDHRCFRLDRMSLPGIGRAAASAQRPTSSASASSSGPSWSLPPAAPPPAPQAPPPPQQGPSQGNPKNDGCQPMVIVGILALVGAGLAGPGGFIFGAMVGCWVQAALSPNP